MIERRPYTPSDYMIGHEGVKGTSDYPSQGTPPRDVFLRTSKMRRIKSTGGRGPIESSAFNPEDALIEAEEEALKYGKKRNLKDARNEDEEGVVGVGLEQNVEEISGTHDPMVLHELRGGIDSRRLKVGPGMARQEEKKYPLRNWHKPSEHRGTHKPKGKKPARLA